MTPSQKYALQLDNLRRKYKYTVDNFCSGIVDPRTFRRYKTGEKNITFTKITAFCEKLKISTTDFFYTSKSEDEIEHQKIDELASYSATRDYQKAKDGALKLNREYIFDVQNRRLYDLVITRAYYRLNEKSNKEILKELSIIADYPRCIEHKAFDFVTISALVLIAEIEIKQQKEDALHLLMEILVDYKMIYTSNSNYGIIPIIYEDVCIFLLRLHRYKAANYIADNGIKYLLKIRVSNGLAHLYYTKAYALLMLDNIEQAEINAVRCLATTTATQNDMYTELFYRVLKKDFKKDPHTFIEKHLKPLIDDAVVRQQKIPK